MMLKKKKPTRVCTQLHQMKSSRHPACPIQTPGVFPVARKQQQPAHRRSALCPTENFWKRSKTSVEGRITISTHAPVSTCHSQQPTRILAHLSSHLLDADPPCQVVADGLAWQPLKGATMGDLAPIQQMASHRKLLLNIRPRIQNHWDLQMSWNALPHCLCQNSSRSNAWRTDWASSSSPASIATS